MLQTIAEQSSRGGASLLASGTFRGYPANHNSGHLTDLGVLSGACNRLNEPYFLQLRAVPPMLHLFLLFVCLLASTALSRA